MSLLLQGAYIHSKEVKAAQGVKIIAKDLDKALAGLPLYVSKYDDEIPVYRVRSTFSITWLDCSETEFLVVAEEEVKLRPSTPGRSFSLHSGS